MALAAAAAAWAPGAGAQTTPDRSWSREPASIFGLRLGRPLFARDIRNCGEKAGKGQERYPFCKLVPPAQGRFELDGFDASFLPGAIIVGGTLITGKGRAESLTLHVQDFRFAEIKATLVERYGAPTRAQKLVVKRKANWTRQDVYYTSEALSWKGKQMDIEVVERAADPGTTSVTFMLAGERPPSEDEASQVENLAAAWAPGEPSPASVLCAQIFPYQSFGRKPQPANPPLPETLVLAPGWEKVHASIQERALLGEPLDVMAVLEDLDTREFVPDKTPYDWVEQPGGSFYSAIHIALQAYGDAVFPQGRMGNVVGGGSGSQVAGVHIPDTAGLLELIRHPKIRCLREIDPITPPL